MKTTTTTFAGMLAFAILLTSAPAAWAQDYRRQSATYQPARPTFSPAFDYFRRDVGLLDTYHTFVRPQRRLQGRLYQQQTELTEQNTRLRRLRSDVQQIREPAAAPTGIGGAYLNYSHYYNLRAGQ